MTRAVLVAPRGDLDPVHLRRMADALDAASAAGYEVVGVLDPQDFREAHRLIGDGTADLILIARPDYLPSVRLALDMATAVPAGPVSSRHRRPQPVHRTA